MTQDWMSLILSSLLLPFLAPPDILACCSFLGPYTCLQLCLHGFPALPPSWVHVPLFKFISQDFFQQGCLGRLIYSSWVMGEWVRNSRFRVVFPLDQQTLHSLSRALTMANEKSITALWLFLCRESAAGQLWGLCVPWLCCGIFWIALSLSILLRVHLSVPFTNLTSPQFLPLPWCNL